MIKKTIALFGATGSTGILLLEKLLELQHPVQVLVRDVRKLKSSPPLLKIEEGDVLCLSDVETCVENAQVVYVLLGTKGNHATTVYSAGIQNIITAMQKHQIRRIICLSSAGIFGSDGGFIFGRIIAPLFLRKPFSDKRRQAKILTASNLDWTLLRPTEIVDKKPTGQLTITYDRPEKMKISRESLVAYLYGEIENRQNIRKMPLLGDQ